MMPTMQTGDTSEDLLRFLYLCPVGVVEIDDRGAVVMLNPLASQLLMPLDSQASLDNLFRLLEPLDRALPAVLGVDAPPGTRLCTARRLSTGEAAARHLDVTAVRLDRGRTMVALLDVTRLVEAEQVVREAEAHQAWQADALRDSEQRLRVALDAAAAGAFTWDVPANRVLADARIRSRAGLPAGQPYPIEHFLERIHPDDRAYARACVDAARQPGGAAGWDMEYRLLAADGDHIWHHSVARVERDSSGQALRVSGLGLDISARKASEAEIHRSHEALRVHAAELEHRTQQLSRLSSELTLAEQRAREQLARTLHDNLQQLLFAAKLKLDRLVSRANATDASPLSSVTVDLEEAMAAARSLSVDLFPPVLRDGGLPAAMRWLAGWAEQKYGLTLDLVIDERANAERKDVRALVFESVRELIFNVVKHAHVRRATVTLTVESDDEVCLSVADQGVGFDPVTMWTQSHDGRIGLGLFSIRERLTLLGGRMDVSSAPGRGARFTLWAPRRDEMPAVPPPDALAPPPDAPAAGVAGHAGRAITVLIADDHALVREGLRELLANHGAFEVVGDACDGREAVDRAVALQPDLVVMDVSMPRMDGVEATRRILDLLPHTVVVGLSTQEQTDGKHAIEEAGARGYVSKDGDAHRLIELLLRVVAPTARGGGVPPSPTC